MKQADGQVTVFSQPNCGTIFEVYLPRVETPVIERAATRTPMGSETILLVDDEEGVRKLCCAVLQAHGYHVLEADSAKAALVVYEKNAHKVDILVTDIVMRQMDGFELARAVWQRTPGLKILYMSGYRDHTGETDPGQPAAVFLHKPFTVILLQLNYLVTGVVVVEALFAYPGFGRMMVEAALAKDTAVLEAGSMFAVFIVVTTQIVGDFGYMLLNPRIRFT